MTGKELADALVRIADSLRDVGEVSRLQAEIAPGAVLIVGPESRDNWSQDHYQAAYERDGRRCRYCGAKDRPLTIDHLVPRSQGGSDFIENLVVCCRNCNSRKGPRTPEQAGMVLS